MDIRGFGNSIGSKLRNGVPAGAIFALTVSILHSITFNLDFWSPVRLSAWYTFSLLIGGISGFVGSFLLRVVSARVPPVLEHAAGALLGLLGYVLQVYVFLRVTFKIVTWE